MPKIKRLLRVGTDCSGIEAPIQALQQLKIPFTHVFSSEIDRFCIKSIKANYSPKIIFGDKEGDYPQGDITKRDITDVPNIDLYVCGFPCQPFSTAGQRKGFEDKRGNVFWSCLEVIETKQPKYFILENVKGLLNHDKGNTWKVIWEALSDLEKYGYTVKWKVLNTRDYGIPQNRERVFMVGVKDKGFEWPEKVKMKKLRDFVDWEQRGCDKPNTKCVTNLLNIVPKSAIFIDISQQRHSHINTDKYCSTLTVSNRHWCIPLNRYMSCKERLSLQGFEKFTQVISKTQLDKQTGNSMSVNVVKKILMSVM